MKSLILIALVLLSGCSTRQMFCAGSGTCFGDERDTAIYQGTSTLPQARSNLPQSILLPTGSVTVIRNTHTGQIQAVIPTSKR